MKTRMPKIEICAASVSSALAAQAGLADRIELCTNLHEGGTTPSHGMLALVCEALRIPVHVLIRPRGGHFVYDADERRCMLADVRHARRLGAAGIVIGALTPEGHLDRDTCRALMDAAEDMSVIFHRAFDVARSNPNTMLEQLIDMGVQGLLTSGRAPTAMQGLPSLRALQQQAGERLEIVAASGIGTDNVASIADSGVAYVHASVRRVRAEAVGQTAFPGLTPEILETTTERVASLRNALQGAR